MKKTSLSVVSQLLLWLLVAVLAYTVFIGGKPTNQMHRVVSHSGIRIAYFSVDSLQSQYEYFLSMRHAFEAKQSAAQEELLQIERKFQTQVKQYEANISNMTQAQSDSEQKKLYQLRQHFEEKKQELQVSLAKDQESFVKKVQQAVSDYIRLHRDKYPYDLVLALQPGLVFYSNSDFDITSQLLEDLNNDFKTNKP